ncbi:MAG: phosphatidylserine decarboxylase family protein [Rhodospirillaceae bacterium]|nr:phosphatidylserine decarboxylase family protein [Rhodospirillaceae bacterium]
MPSIKVHKEGYPFITAFAFTTLIFFLLDGWAWMLAGFVLAILTLWCVYFFRDPDRVTPVEEGLVISPADGVIQSVTDASPPPELGLDLNTMRRVSIFMNVFDCHINRSPIDGKLISSSYCPGKFFNASLDKASIHNERRAMRMTTVNGDDLVIVQIAGLVARRIICWKSDDTELKTGERFGMIRFGSRVDVYLQNTATILAVVGQRAVAGETVIADLKADREDRKGETR